MSVLVTLSDLKVFLGVADNSQDAVLTPILDEVEALFEIEIGRRLIAFVGADTARTQILDGTGTDELYLDRPIAALTSIKLGFDSANPIETLSVANPEQVTFEVGKRRIARTDGGVFGAAGKPRYVHVGYTSLADAATAAKTAIKRGCAIVYRQRGSEDSSKESIPDFSHDLALLREDNVWQLAAAGERRMVLA